MKKGIKVLIGFVLAIALAGSGFWLVHRFIESKEQQASFRELAESVLMEVTPQKPMDVTTPEPEAPEVSHEHHEPTADPAPQVLHDIAALKEKNAECVGWIRVPGTDVDYPVMWTPEGPERYLRRDFYGGYSDYGVPFLDHRCDLDSDNLILYGHNMFDGTMFTDLLWFREREYMEDHSQIILETPGGAREYRVIAVCQANSVESRLYQHINFTDSAGKDVAFSLPEGCITGFIGVNGAGKTTTLRTLLRLTDKEAGKIQFFGLDMEQNERQIKDRLGIVLDDGCFYEELSLSEMKSIIAPAYTAWSERDFKQYMDMFSLDPKQKINTLSKGMRMKYALALALSHEAELLIMDEPTSGLDPLVRSQLLKILTEYMSKGGKGVFFSTHITSDLDKIADMLIMIDNGSIVFQEEKDTLLDTYRIVKGDVRALTPDLRKLFLNIYETAFGFTGITKQVAEVQRMLPDAMIERPAIEDIMLGNIEGGNK